jgi:ubiquinol-cytochrome c reductase cytochrome b subunit
MTYDYYYGYLYRNIHIVLATIINILLLIHIFKGLLYNNLSNQIYIHYSGYILYLLLIIISYLGYILTYGQLAYWGATVIINLLPISAATLILGNYNISEITINRYLMFHIILTLILYVFIIIHIFYLHQLSSQSPLPISILSTSASQLHITFQHFILKDITSLIFLLFIFISIALFILLNLSHSYNLQPINPLSTPLHIIPEWYFLYLYSILKIIPSKMGGILTVIITILIILLLTTSNYSYNLYNTNSLSISNYSNIDTIITILLSYIYLAYIGLQLPIAPYLINLGYFLLYIPIPIIIISLLSNFSINSLILNISSKFNIFSLINNSNKLNYISLLSTTNHKKIGFFSYLIIVKVYYIFV